MNTARRSGCHSRVNAGFGAALVVALAVAGCRSAPKPGPLTAPPVTLAVDYHSGDPLGGGAAPLPEDAGDPKKAIAAHVELFSLEHPPTTVPLEPLEARVRLVTSARGSQPFPPVPEALAGSSYAVGDEADAFEQRLLSGGLGRFARIGGLHAAVPAHVTADLEIRGQVLHQTAADGEWLTDHLEIKVYSGTVSEPGVRSLPGPGAKGLSLALAVQTQNFSEDHEAASTAPVQPLSILREACHLDLNPAVGETVLILVPTPVAETRSRMVAAFLRTAQPGIPASPAFLAALQRCTESLAAGVVTPEQVSRERMALERERCDLDAALQGLSTAKKQRQALVFLARLTGARLALESAFLLDDETVARIAGSILERTKSREVGDEPGPASAAAIGWHVEQSAADVLTAMLNRTDTPIQIEGLLVRYAGEAGRHAGAMAAIFSDSEDLETLRRHLVRANLLFLDAHSLAARIRAIDWMKHHGHAVEGYDPLGPREQRREAIRRAEAAAAARPATETSP